MNAPLTFDFCKYSGINQLDVPGIRTHVIDVETGNEYLASNEPYIYPQAMPRCGLEMLLGRLGTATFEDEKVNVYVLPKDYVGFDQVLNDAVSSSSDRATNLGRAIFREIGKSIGKVYKNSKLVPVGMSYRDIIIERDVPGFKLLPPIEFVNIEDEETLIGFGKQFLDDLIHNSGNERRAQLVKKMFEGYTEAVTG